MRLSTRHNYRDRRHAEGYGDVTERAVQRSRSITLHAPGCSDGKWLMATSAPSRAEAIAAVLPLPETAPGDEGLVPPECGPAGARSRHEGIAPTGSILAGCVIAPLRR